MADDSRELLDTFESFYRTLCEDRDADGAFALWAGDEDIVLLGSEQRDAAFGPAAVRAHLGVIAGSTNELAFTWSRQQAHVERDAAWVSASGTITVGGRTSAYQSTGVFVRRDGRWLWHTHSGSEPRSA
ncbi:MAG TPA: nuclear transport factor 2 family protein [Gaiellaceae bacterium]|jgi:ketosteroid isomerase-like protein